MEELTGVKEEQPHTLPWADVHRNLQNVHYNNNNNNNHTDHAQAGYREGREKGKNQVLQEAFDESFKRALPQGIRAGEIIGAVSYRIHADVD